MRNKSEKNHRVVVGLHSVREVFKIRPKKIIEIWLKLGAERSRDHADLIELAKKHNIKVLTKSDGALDKLASSHQGAAAFVSETPELDLSSLVKSEAENIILLALDEVTDPHNLGAALRTAWLLGVSGILVPENRSAHLTPAVIKVASGGAEHVPLLVVGNLVVELGYLKENGFWIYGLSSGGENNLTQTRFNEKIVLVVGSEEKGLRSTTVNVCDELVSIPQIDSSASYNASVAIGIAMFEVFRQHAQR